MSSFIRELKFALRDRVVLVSLIGLVFLSSYSLISGVKESASELALIERVEKLVTQDREYNLAKQSNAGGAAYYAFHFTYDPPSPLAFISRGVRDDLPWKHRIRMLAIEGQIYETDTGNPELSKVGKLDFAFVAAFLLPLLAILLLYDLRAVEIRSNRWAFLSVTAGNGNRLLMVRAALRATLLCIALLIPFIVTALINDADFLGVSQVIGVVVLSCAFWCLLSFFVLMRVESGPTTAALLLGFWFMFSVAIPVGGKYLVERSITTPNGGEVLLAQREAVNGAWDLSKEATMKPFLEYHPEWADTAEVIRPFEWKWYYAFQQMGDQTVASMSAELRERIADRDNAMAIVSMASPSLITTRLLSQVAHTDIASFQRYDACVRGFHKSLREFHYPMLFGSTEYSAEQLLKLPDYKPCRHSI